MPTNRKVVFANNYYYHIFNRGIDRRNVFTDKREFYRATEALKYYRFGSIKVKLSRFLKLSGEEKSKLFSKINENNKLVEIISYCLMPNHFHFLLKQLSDGGISKFIANFTNSYTKYFNTKHERTGPLFQGLFKAVFIESDEQLIHLSRYIHLNPSTSSIITINKLTEYLWSSFPEYIIPNEKSISSTWEVLNFFKNQNEYEKFVFDHALYAKELHKIKHLILE